MGLIKDTETALCSCKCFNVNLYVCLSDEVALHPVELDILKGRRDI